MPNHVTNILHINGTPEQVKEVRDSIRGRFLKEDGSDDGEQVFDFNKLLPMPESLNCSSGSESRIAQYEMGYETRGRPPMKPMDRMYESADQAVGDQCKENIRLHGHPTWYEWHIENWGTKWGAYQQEEIEPNILQFQTAWSCPLKILEALTAKFPEIEFVVKYADEDIGSNCGTLTFKGGELAKEEHPRGKEAVRFAYKVNGYSDDDIKEREDEIAADEAAEAEG
jgi:hypothetical protein